VDPRTLIRIAQTVLVVLAVAIAAVPLLVLFDLASGGTGYGICPGGLGDCRNPYSAAPRVSALLTVGLVVVLAGFRILSRLRRRLTRRRVPPFEG
jgi:hypothetical protein